MALQLPDVDGPEPAVSGLGRGMAWSYVQLGSTAVVSLVVSAVVLRRLGPADFGVFALIAASSAFVKCLELGLGLTVVRATARQATSIGSDERARARADITAAHSLYVVLGVAAMGVMALVAVFLPVLLDLGAGQVTDVRVTTLLVGLALGLSLGTSALGGIAGGLRDFRARALAGVLGSAVSLVVVLTLVGRAGLVTLGLAELTSVVFARAVLVAWARRRAPWFRLRPRWLAAADARRVAGLAVPLVVLSIGGQVIASTDLFILGGFYAAATVGLYRVGSLLATQAITVLYQGYDVVLPALAASDDAVEQERTMAFLSRVGCFAGGLVLGTIALLRNDLVLLVTGRVSSLAASVLLVFCAVWLANLVTHGLGLLLIARGRQRILLWPVVGEMVFNLALTLVLLHLIGPVGAAVSTLVTVGVSHTVIVPFVARHELTGGVTRLVVVDGWLPLAAGVVLAAACCSAVVWIGPSFLRVACSSALALVSGTAVGALLLRGEGRKDLKALLRRTPVE